jgi:hypothetical protein
MLCEGREIVTAPDTVLDVRGEVAVTDVMPGAGYCELIYVPICVTVKRTDVPDCTASSCSVPLSDVAAVRFGI